MALSEYVCRFRVQVREEVELSAADLPEPKLLSLWLSFDGRCGLPPISPDLRPISINLRSMYSGSSSTAGGIPPSRSLQIPSEPLLSTSDPLLNLCDPS